MEEILFKAKRIDNGEWVEGDILHTKHHEIVIISDYEDKAYRCDGTTLCQFTGLTDKNGKKIWENDIVTITIECDDYFILSETGIVEYSYGQYELKVKTTDGKEAYSNLINKLSEAPFEIEKLGNIFDNADLLEVN